MSQKATWVGEPFEYSDEDKRRIGADLWSKAGAEIQGAAEDYRVEQMLQEEAPGQSKVNGQLRKLAASIRRVLDVSRDLDDRAIDAVEIWARSQFEKVGFREVSVVRGKLSSLALELERTAADGKPGRSREEARRRFVYRLAEIWEQVHGEWPKRGHGFDATKATHEERGEFLDFVRACIGPINSSALTGIGSEVRHITTLG